ncbi:MAG: branched-chain amino acid ABC transporter permease [Chloroflexota bacterium]|nr:branched-chain amino acid ABC transporter permease [Chloroflexota bacterium]
MQLLLDQVVNGVTLGAVYALVAIGLTLIFGIVRLVNFAHGEFLMVGAYILFFAYAQAKLPYGLVIVLCVLGMAVFGALFHKIVFEPVMNRPWYVQLVATLAGSVILVNAAIIAFGGTQRGAPTTLADQTLILGATRISYQRVLTLLVTLLAFVLLNLFIQRTETGRTMRAVSQNREAAQVLGVDIGRVALVTFSLSAAMAGLAAALIAPLQTISPTMGALLTLKAFAIVVIGGMGKVMGAIYAAFLVGLVEALATVYVSSAYKDAVVFLMMIAVLLWRPRGLFGQKVGI